MPRLQALLAFLACGSSCPRPGSLLHQRREGAFKKKYEQVEMDRAINDYRASIFFRDF